MFANPKHLADPVHAIEPDEQCSTTCHENETKEHGAEREARRDLCDAIQRSFDLRILG
jgi:hypothetical protein